MRTTVRLDDDLFDDLRRKAEASKVSLTRALNDALRAGLRAPGAGSPARRRRYREKPVSLGVPRVDLTKALSIAAALEEEEIVRKTALRK